MSWPITARTFSKFTERMVKLRLTDFLSNNNLVNSFQSAYIKHHSTAGFSHYILLLGVLGTASPIVYDCMVVYQCFLTQSFQNWVSCPWSNSTTLYGQLTYLSSTFLFTQKLIITTISCWIFMQVKLIGPLQLILNFAAYAVVLSFAYTRTPQFHHITAILKSFHLLTINHKIQN